MSQVVNLGHEFADLDKLHALAEVDDLAFLNAHQISQLHDLLAQLKQQLVVGLLVVP